MAYKKNKQNRRRTAYYHINKFNYEMKEKLIKEQLSSKKTYISEKVIKIKLRSDYQ